MSLLLDALKRAEEAKRAKGVEGPGGTEEAPRKVDEPLPFEELSLEDYAQEPAAPVPPSRPAPAPSPQKRPVLDFTRDVVAPTTPQAEANAPSARLVRQDFSLHQESQSYDASQRDVAKSVFSAKQTVAGGDDSARGKWLLPLIAFLVVGLGGAGWYVWNEVTRFSRGAAGAVATRPPPPVSGPLAAAAPTTGQAAPPQAAGTEKPASLQLPPLLPPPAQEARQARVAGLAAGIRADRALSERELLARNLRESSRMQKGAPVSLKLSQSIDAPRINPDVAAAYDALTRGDYGQARQRYERALQAEPLNIDAHLGLAATAARMGESAMAAQHYRRALDLDPRNGTALAGLLAINGSANPQAMENELRTLIAKDPDSAALQFSLGNLYAGDRRWREAQQAYFEAYRLESENADYRYNLAVALDHLKQDKLALDYYQKALAQALKGGAQFDSVAVKRRIAELSAP